MTATSIEPRAQHVESDLVSEVPKFWSRFKHTPEFSSGSVLEIGCGLGALCIDMARRGATDITGVDILVDDIAFATQYVKQAYPELTDNLHFTSDNLAQMDGQSFNLIVSKDSFEHILDVPAMLALIKQRLAPGGRVYIGFSPLYHSPYGDHDRRRTAFAAWGPIGKLLAALPWGHLILEPLILRRHTKMRGEPVVSMHDLNLNKMSIRAFKRYIKDAGFRTVIMDTNQGNNKIGKFLGLFNWIPGLDVVCTYNVYCILEAET